MYLLVVLRVQASLVIAQADQLDAGANAALVGTQAEPTQPEVGRNGMNIIFIMTYY